jgi:hypothetical protein
LIKAATPPPSEFVKEKAKLPAAEQLIPFARMTMQSSLERIS